MKHPHEHLRRDHGYTLGYTVTRLALQKFGEMKPTSGRGKHRKKRVRRPLPGMMLFQDGSVHEYPDGRLAVFDAPRCLARYAANGVLIDDPK